MNDIDAGSAVVTVKVDCDASNVWVTIDIAAGSVAVMVRIEGDASNV